MPLAEAGGDSRRANRYGYRAVARYCGPSAMPRRVADLLLPGQFGGLHATLLLAKHAGYLILRKWPRRIIRCHLTSHRTNDMEFGEHVKPQVNAAYLRDSSDVW
jgi:hypothetical protein